ncbi:MAG: hypothetical protein ACPGLV_06710 [Bacteroidia bacterium]
MKKNILILGLLFTGLLFSCDPETKEEIIDRLESIDRFEGGNAALRGEIETTEDALEAIKSRPLRPEIDCATISHDSSTQTVSLDFGTTGCAGEDGRVRSGLLEFVYGGNFRNPTKYRKLIFTDFKVDTTLINGTYTFAPLGKNADSNFTFSVQIDKASLAFDNGYAIEFDLERTWTWTSGAGNLDNTDDEYEVLGSASGSDNATGRDAKSFEMIIDEALLYKTTCWQSAIYYPTMGLVTAKEGNLTFEVDYGTGSCDKDVTITKGLVSYTKTLP